MYLFIFMFMIFFSPLRYLLCLQLRTDILSGRLLCSSDMLAVLGSYTIQSEFGDYNPELHRKEFFRNIALAPNQTPELEENVIELHRTLRYVLPANIPYMIIIITVSVTNNVIRTLKQKGQTKTHRIYLNLKEI